MTQRETPYQEREAYAIHHGDYTGKMFIVIGIETDTVNCLIIPDMENIKVPLSSFERGRNTDIIKYVEILSKDVYGVVKKQYKKNENANN